MGFSCTNLSGVIDIPEKCTEYFSCNVCKEVSGFTGWAKIMRFNYTNLSGIINIPEEYTDVFSCYGCHQIIEFTGNTSIVQQ